MLTSLMAGARWLLLLRGTLALLFGLIAIANVGATAIVLFVWFVIFTISDGIFIIVMAIAGRKEQIYWGLELLWGLASLGIGVAAWLWPQLTALILLYLIAVRAIMAGVFEMILAFRAPPKNRREWLMALGGVISLIFGVLMIFQPIQLALALLWVIGCWAIALGLILIVAAFGPGSRTPTSV